MERLNNPFEKALDKDGFLKDLASWDPAMADALALLEGRQLTDSHWEVMHILRAFYRQTEVAPAMRPFVKLVREKLGADKGNSIYLMEQFGSSPAKTAAKWSGLPRPTNCL